MVDLNELSSLGFTQSFAQGGFIFSLTIDDFQTVCEMEMHFGESMEEDWEVTDNKLEFCIEVLVYSEDPEFRRIVYTFREITEDGEQVILGKDETSEELFEEFIEFYIR